MTISTDNFLSFFGKDRDALKKRRLFLFFRIVLYTFFIAVFVSLILSAFYFWAINDVYKLSKAGKVNLEMAASEVEKLNFKQADVYLAIAENNFESARLRFAGLVFSKKIPWIKYQYGAVSSMLDAGVGTITALRDLVEIANDVLGSGMDALLILDKLPIDDEKSFIEIATKQKRDILERISKAGPALETAKQKIDLAFLSIDEIREDKVIGKILDNIEPMREALLKLQTTINKAVPMARILPNMAGYPKEKTHLFLLQNNDELRPTGGFIGTYGVVRIKDGEIKLFETDNIYTLDRGSDLQVEPPAPLLKYLDVKKLFLRDSNWSPNFPDAASKAKWFYYAEGGEEKGIDTVVAITPDFIENVLKQIGDIKLGDETFSASNLMEVLQYKVEKEYYEKGIPEANRKDIVGDLANEIFKKIASLPASRWSEIIKVVKNAFAEKDILVWSEDLILEDLILKEGWGGEIKRVEGDYLMVVDANLGAYKTDGVMDKNIKYSVFENKDGKIHAKVEIKYKNKGSFTWKTTHYRTYTRVYVPNGSVLVGGSGTMENDKTMDPRRRSGKIDIGNEFDKTYFGAFISVEPGEIKTLSFEYILPQKISKSIAGDLYTLFVQRQPGAEIDSLTLDLDFDKNIKYARPEEEKKKWGDSDYNVETDLNTDKSFEVGF